MSESCTTVARKQMPRITMRSYVLLNFEHIKRYNYVRVGHRYPFVFEFRCILRDDASFPSSSESIPSSSAQVARVWWTYVYGVMYALHYISIMGWLIDLIDSFESFFWLDWVDSYALRNMIELIGIFSLYRFIVTESIHSQILPRLSWLIWHESYTSLNACERMLTYNG